MPSRAVVWFRSRAPSKSRFVLFVRGPHHEPAPHGGVDPGRKVGSGGRHTRTLGAYRDFDGALPFIQAWVRSTTQRLPAWTGAGTPLRAISPRKPNVASSLRVEARASAKCRSVGFMGL